MAARFSARRRQARQSGSAALITALIAARNLATPRGDVPSSGSERPLTSLKYRLAAVTSHPVQYQGPLFQRLAAHERLDLTVFYGHDASLVGELDRDFGVPVTWDRPLLAGYRSVFLKRRAQGLGAVQRLVADARIITHLWRQRFDAVFIHSYATRLSLFAYLGAVLSRTPVLLRTESERLRPRPPWVEALKHALLRPLFAVTAGFLVIGEMNREFVQHYGVKRSRQFFTPYSVDNEYFAEQRGLTRPLRRELRQAHGWTDEVVVVGFSGKLIPRKGIGDLVDAVATLQAEGLPVGLLIIGEGPDRSVLQRRVESQAVTLTVFAGFKNQSELAPCYTCLDIFVLPSRFDPWGLVLNEAMLFGLPVLASTKVGAGVDLIQHGKNGYLFEAGDVPALTEGLRGLVRSAATRRQFGACSEVIVRRYSYDACVRGILDGLRHATRRTCARSHATEHGEVDL